MHTAKEISFLAIMTALLIGGQLALSSIAGVEVVTVLLLTFCTVFGVKRGMIVATAFSFLRCFLFGFFPYVIILYLVYYNLFAIIWGSIGSKKKKMPFFLILILACICTIFFTLLDDVLYPLMAGMNWKGMIGYITYSLPVMATQTICTFVTVLLLFYPLSKIFKGALNSLCK